jgi:long-chain acyl-CoA synthetase
MTAYIWEKSYPDEISWSDPLPEAVRVEQILEAVVARSTGTCIDFYDHRISFDEFYALCRRAAAGFQKLGVGPGVHVGLHLPNTPHMPICFFGVLMAGGCVVPLHPGLSFRTLSEQVRDADVSVVVTFEQSPSVATSLPSRGWDRLAVKTVVCHMTDFLDERVARELLGSSVSAERHEEPSTTFAQLATAGGQYIPLQNTDPADLAALLYTGGTTGRSKRAMLTHANLAAAVHVTDRCERLWTSEVTSRKALCALPLTHVFGLMFTMLRPILSGFEVVLHYNFDTTRVLTDLQRKRIGMFGGVPQMYAALLNHSRFREFDLSSLVFCAAAGSPLPPGVRMTFEEITGVPLDEGYGLTETAAIAARQLPGARRPDTVGLPSPHTNIEIVDLEDGLTVLPEGEFGEICISGPTVMNGYWRSPAETAEAFRGGRFHTGDVGFIDEDGFVAIRDRKKEMILSGGFNIFPGRLERSICEHPDVVEAAVVGVPSPELGEVPKAFIVLRPNAQALTFGDLIRFLKTRLSSYEIPAEVEFIDALPRTILAKVAKRALLRHP